MDQTNALLADVLQFTVRERTQRSPIQVIDAHITELLMARPQTVSGYLAAEHTIKELRAIKLALQVDAVAYADQELRRVVQLTSITERTE